MSQFLFTREGAMVEVDRIVVVSGKQDAEGNWIQQGGKVAVLSNNSYCHGDLLPFTSEEEIRLIFTSLDKNGNPIILPEMQEFLDKVLAWFARKDEFAFEQIPKIEFDENGWPHLADGTPVDEALLYQYPRPTHVITAAIIGMHERRKAEANQAAAAKPEFYKQAGPKPPPGMPKVAGDLVAKPKEPEKPKSGKGSGKPLGKKALKSFREKRATTRAAKAAAAAG